MKAVINPRYRITTCKAEMDVAQIHAWLSTTSYWAAGIPFKVVETAIENSWCIAVLAGSDVVGFARVITDYATFGYLADVYVMEAHQGQGIGKAMMDTIMLENWVAVLRRFMLATKDAHGLYQQYGFVVSKTPERLMEIVQADIYQR